jgi:hypothetical protein
MFASRKRSLDSLDILKPVPIILPIGRIVHVVKAGRPEGRFHPRCKWFYRFSDAEASFFTVIFPDLLTVRFLLPLFFLKVTAPCAFLMVNAFAFFIVCFFFAVFAAFTEGFFALAVRVFSFLECFSMVLSSPSVTPSTSISLLHNS